MNTSTSDIVGWAVVSFFFAFWLAAVVGWIANIVKIFWAAGDPITGWFIARCVGVFLAPVGAVLGRL